jgi:hypothetical protein
VKSVYRYFEMKRNITAVFAACACILVSGSCVGDLGPDGFDCIFQYDVRPRTPGASLSIAAGDSIALLASRTPNCGAVWPVTWSVEQTAVASIRATGDSTAMLRGLTPGTAVVNARNGTRSGFTVVTVTAP